MELHCAKPVIEVKLKAWMCKRSFLELWHIHIAPLELSDHWDCIDIRTCKTNVVRIALAAGTSSKYPIHRLSHRHFYPVVEDQAEEEEAHILT